MSCPECAGTLAWNDQLQESMAALLEHNASLTSRILELEHKNESLTRQLREALDELRLRRAATGYLPVLDRPEG